MRRAILPPCLAVFALLSCTAALAASADRGFWTVGFEQGLAAADAAGKPAFVYFHAPWCSWCQVYERDTLDDPKVRAALARDFVPVLEEFDARPDLLERYGGRGLPFTVVTDAAGDPLARFVGVLGPGDLLDALAAVATARPVARPGLDEPPLAAVQSVDRAGYEAFRDDYLAHLEALFTPFLGTLSAGVFDSGVTLRDASPRAWSYLQAQGLWTERAHAAARTEAGRLLDPVGGGFFNFIDPYAREGDHVENSKLVEINAWMSAWLSAAGRQFDDPALRNAARSGVYYLREVLRDPAHGGLRRAQYADNDYYRLPPAQRLRERAPPLDPSFRSDLNAQAAFALLRYAEHADEPGAVPIAAGALDFVLREMLRDDTLFHSRREDFGPVRNKPEDLFWTLAAGAELQRVAPDAERERRLASVVAIAQGWLEAATSADPDATDQPPERLGAVAWVATDPAYAELLGDATEWALAGLRIDTETAPDDLVLGLLAWERYLQTEGP